MPCYPRRRLTKTGYLACLVISVALISRTKRTGSGAAQDTLSIAQAASLNDTTRTAIDPAAAAAVGRMTTYLAGLPGYSVHLEPTTDETRAAERILYALLVAGNKHHGPSPAAKRTYRSRNASLPVEVESAIVVGTGWVGGVECDRLAFHQRDVDWQLWVERGTRALPHRIAVTRGKLGARPEVVMLTWHLGSQTAPPSARVRTWSHRSGPTLPRS